MTPLSARLAGAKLRLLQGQKESFFGIFCVTETKIDNNDIISLPGYKLFPQCRTQKYLRKSGGIGIHE